jgi:hypothetical protein
MVRAASPVFVRCDTEGDGYSYREMEMGREKNMGRKRVRS